MKPISADSIEAQIRAAIDAGANADLLDQLGHQLGRADQKPEPSLPGAALWYANTGLRVFPLQPGRKDPYPASHGCLDATSDQDQIISWWTHRPNANIGIATGHLVDVIDIDGPDGVHSWVELGDGLPPILGTVSTPRDGGSHLYVPATGRGNKARIYPGIDYRGRGGYVVAPPSTLAVDPARTYHGPYTWRRPLNLGEQ